MKSKIVLSSLLFAALAASGCEKAPDLNRLQEDTLDVVRVHGQEVESLQRRADALFARGREVGGSAPGINEAGRLLGEARSGIDALRMQVSTAPSTLATAAKSGNGDDVQRASDELLDKLDEGEIAVRANLAAVDNWLMTVENHTGVASVPAVPPPPAAPPPATDESKPPEPNQTTTPPATPPGAEAGSGAPAAGSAAPPAKP